MNKAYDDSIQGIATICKELIRVLKDNLIKFTRNSSFSGHAYVITCEARALYFPLLHLAYLKLLLSL